MQGKSLEEAILSASDFKLMPIPERKKFIDPFLTEDTMNLISGLRGIGKSWLVSSILSAVATGENFGPWKGGEAVPVLYLDGEMTTYDFQERIKRIHTGNKFYVYSCAFGNELGLPRAHLVNRRWRDEMKNLLLEYKIKLWAIDNLASLAGGLDENSKRDWDPINQWLLELRFVGIATIMLHHTGKGGDQRGTSAREDNLDNSIVLKLPHDYVPSDGARFIMHFQKSRSVNTKDLSLIQDMEFQLTEDETGELLWTYKPVKAEIRREVLRMLSNNVSYDSICDTLNISKGYVSRIKKQAINEDLLTGKGILTSKGDEYIQEALF